MDAVGNTIADKSTSGKNLSLLPDELLLAAVYSVEVLSRNPFYSSNEEYKSALLAFDLNGNRARLKHLSVVMG
jgi:hypothetical protein